MKSLKNVEPTRLVGLKIFVVGFLVALGGFGLAALGLLTLGWLVMAGGVLAAAVGMITHLVLFARHNIARLSSLESQNQPPSD
jgi:hypothetical protein